MPLGVSYKDVRTWGLVVTRFERMLAGWKKNLMSKDERLTLIKSTLADFLIYYMSFLTISVSVIKRLKSIQCRFSRIDYEDRRKYHLVA